MMQNVCIMGAAEGVLDYGVLGEPAYVTWVGLTGREDTEPKACSRVRMGLSFAWTASLASGCVVYFHCKPTLYTPSPSDAYINRRSESIGRITIIHARHLGFSHYDLEVDQLL